MECFSSMKKQLLIRSQERNLYTHATNVVNSCQGKVSGVLFRLNYSIRQHLLALDVIQVLDGRNYFQSC